MITVVHWLKTYNNCAETHLGGGFWALLSSFWLPFLVDRSCDVTYMAMHTLGHNNDAAKRYSVCEQARNSTIFCVKASNTASNWFLQVL